MEQNNTYDVIIIGGGHAGTEAASAAARAGSKVLLITQKLSAIGEMSCNPAIGGIGKGHLTKEIDALGGIMARAIDQAGIHFRVLNASKGPAVRATRAQADRTLYKTAVVALLKKEKNLSLLEETVDSLIIEKDIIIGVQTKKSGNFIAKSVVLTTGTFLAGKILFGDHSEEGGRIGDRPSNNLANNTKYDLITMPINKSVFKKNMNFVGMTEYLGKINKTHTSQLVDKQNVVREGLGDLISIRFLFW